MTAKTIRRIPTFLVIAAIGVAAFVFYPSLRTGTGKADPLVVVTISFDPKHRTGEPAAPGRTLADRVMFQITMGDVFFPKEYVTDSPTVRSFPAQRGANTTTAKVTVRAEQFYGRSLTCRIDYPGMPPSTLTKPGPTEVSCTMSIRVGG